MSNVFSFTTKDAIETSDYPSTELTIQQIIEIEKLPLTLQQIGAIYGMKWEETRRHWYNFINSERGFLIMLQPSATFTDSGLDIQMSEYLTMFFITTLDPEMQAQMLLSLDNKDIHKLIHKAMKLD